MESKSGRVYLQPRKPGRKWKEVWLTLVPPSSSTMGRLEIQEIPGTIPEHGLRKHQTLGERKPKVIRLSELLQVLRLPPNAEACPMENMCAFCVETQDRTLVFAANKNDCSEWVNKLCLSSFQKPRVPEATPQMEENVIYASAEDVSEFVVWVQSTDAALRCGLKGELRLCVDSEALRLRDQKNTLQEWPYELLRRYGKDQGSLSIETGRRCDCGPGTFIFETPRAESLFCLIQSTIKRKTSPSALETESKPSPPTRRSPSPRPYQDGHHLTSLSAILEKPLKMVEDQLDVTSVSAILEKKLKVEEKEPTMMSQPAPITLMPLPSLPELIPTQSARKIPENVYADPGECLRSPDAGMALYVDPASILPLRLPPETEERDQRERDQLHSVYSEVFDRIHTETEFKDENIYSEPVREEVKEEVKEEAKEDQFAHLYAQVQKPNRRSPFPQPKPRREAKTVEDDVIYENLGII